MDYYKLSEALGAASQSSQGILDLSNLGIEELPPNIGALEYVAWLDLSNNNIRHLPSEIGELKKLKGLDLSHNQLDNLPPSIEPLLAHCKIQLHSNPLREIPESVSAQGSQSVLTYLQSRWSKSESQWISKLLIVGEGGVGKSCLVNALKSRKFDPQSDTTHGIRIEKLDILHPKKDELKNVIMRLNCWDFGGQEIYHATHQFFYSNRSLFALVWNARLGYAQSEVYAWLERIHLLAPGSPVILVATHIDERKSAIPIEDLQARYPQIKGSFFVSNKSSEGIRELVSSLAELASNLPLMGEKWPQSWLDSAEEIRSRKDNHISNKELDKIFGKNHVDTKSRKVLARWLHDLGDILYYPDDEDLKHRVFLNPQWVTETISSVLECEDIDGGVFTRENIDKVWPNLSRELQIDFLALMEKFDLSYKIEDPKKENSAACLVVELLPLNPPDYNKEWDEMGEKEGTSELKLTYNLNSSTPPGIPSWFIARSHRFSINKHWRFGAMLQDPNNKDNLALIETPPNSRRIQLTVRGKTPYNLFVIVRDGLELTLARYPGLEIQKTIPCKNKVSLNCSHEFVEEDVTRRLHKKKATIECPKCDENVEVAELIFGINLIDQFSVVSEFENKLIKQHSLKKMNDALVPQEVIIKKLHGIQELLQREFTKNQNIEQNFHESHCPSVFSLRPLSSSGFLKETFLKQEWEMELYCEMPGKWHPIGCEGVYKIDTPAEWLTTIAPHISKIAKAMKYLTPVVGPWLEYDDTEAFQLIEKDIKLIEGLVKLIPDVDYESISHSLEESQTPLKAAGVSIRRLRILLDHLDPNQTWGNLRKVCTPEGHYFWLCEHHALEIIKAPSS